MIKTGICSITLKSLSVKEVIATVVKAGLDGVELEAGKHKLLAGVAPMENQKNIN